LRDRFDQAEGFFDMSRQQRPSRFDRSDDVVVMKFGGTSVEDAAAIRRLIDIVRSRLDAQPVLVVSALAKVTDQLLEAGSAAAAGGLGAALDLVRAIYVRHEQLAEELVEGAPQRTLEGELRGEFHSLELFLRELDASRTVDLKSQDRLLGFGECLSSRLVAAALVEAGLHAELVDARTCIFTDAHHGQAAPLWDATNQAIQDAVAPLLESGYVPVLGGFIASTTDGVPTTLGRGGSDYTAAIVGAALGAARVEIWTDVDGIMTADPKLCAEARPIRRMSFEEAAESARCGAKVLHPATLEPAMRENFPIYVLNSRNPEDEGTEILPRVRTGSAEDALKAGIAASSAAAVAAKRDLAAVQFEPHQALDAKLRRESNRGISAAAARNVFR
jgi:aspartate kinase